MDWPPTRPNHECGHVAERQVAPAHFGGERRALRQLLRAADFRALVGAENRWRVTPLVSALVASPFKAKHWECALLLAPAAAWAPASARASPATT